MTIEELINQLQKYDKNMKVVLNEYVCKSINGMNVYFPEPIDIVMTYDKLHEGCITLILDCDESFENNQNIVKERFVQSDEDCADCLCRVCARNSCNDSYNIELEGGYANCSCNCTIGDKLIETEDDCPSFLPDEDLI